MSCGDTAPGPPEVLAVVQPGSEGHLIGSPEALAAWLATCGGYELAEPFTFVIGLDGSLRVAPRRSERVASAAGAPVLSAGEITFSRDQGYWRVSEVSNLSVGYCPDSGFMAHRRRRARPRARAPGSEYAPPS